MGNTHLCPSPVLRCCQAPEKLLLWAMQAVVWITCQVGCESDYRHHSAPINMSLSSIFTDLVWLPSIILVPIILYHCVSILIHDPYRPHPQPYSMPMHPSYISVSNQKPKNCLWCRLCDADTLETWNEVNETKTERTSQRPASCNLHQPSLWQTWSWFFSAFEPGESSHQWHS